MRAAERVRAAGTGRAAIRWIALAVAAVAAGRAAQAGLYSAIEQFDVAPAATALESTDCGDDARVGGGIDTLAAGSLTVHRTEPSDVSASWNVNVRNDGGATAEFVTAAICADHLPAPTLVSLDFPVPGQNVLEEIVFCPPGSVATSGGASATGNFPSSSVAATSPYFPFATGGARLRNRDAGAGPAPTAWFVAERGETSGNVIGTASVVCVGTGPIATEIAIGSTGSAAASYDFFVVCPPGWTAVGGGVDADDLTVLRLATNGPLYQSSSDPLPRRLAVQTPGRNRVPIGWLATLRSLTPTPQAVRVAAVCVPEPAAAGAGSCAALALLGFGGCAQRRGGGSAIREEGRMVMARDWSEGRACAGLVTAALPALAFQANPACAIIPGMRWIYVLLLLLCPLAPARAQVVSGSVNPDDVDFANIPNQQLGPYVFEQVGATHGRSGAAGETALNSGLVAIAFDGEVVSLSTTGTLYPAGSTALFVLDEELSVQSASLPAGTPAPTRIRWQLDYDADAIHSLGPEIVAAQSGQSSEMQRFRALPRRPAGLGLRPGPAERAPHGRGRLGLRHRPVHRPERRRGAGGAHRGGRHDSAHGPRLGQHLRARATLLPGGRSHPASRGRRLRDGGGGVRHRVRRGGRDAPLELPRRTLPRSLEREPRQRHRGAAAAAPAGAGTGGVARSGPVGARDAQGVYPIGEVQVRSWTVGGTRP